MSCVQKSYVDVQVVLGHRNVDHEVATVELQYPPSTKQVRPFFTCRRAGVDICSLQKPEVVDKIRADLKRIPVVPWTVEGTSQLCITNAAVRAVFLKHAPLKPGPQRPEWMTPFTQGLVDLRNAFVRKAKKNLQDIRRFTKAFTFAVWKHGSATASMVGLHSRQIAALTLNFHWGFAQSAKLAEPIERRVKADKNSFVDSLLTDASEDMTEGRLKAAYAGLRKVKKFTPTRPTAMPLPNGMMATEPTDS